MFDGECVPDLSYLEKVFNELDDDKYPHAWRGTVICFGVGLVVMAFTEALAILVETLLIVLCVTDHTSVAIHPIALTLDHLLSRLLVLFRVHRLQFASNVRLHTSGPGGDRLPRGMGIEGDL